MQNSQKEYSITYVFGIWKVTVLLCLVCVVALRKANVMVAPIFTLYERTVQTMSELKPCPFCGGKAQRGFITHAYGHKMYFSECSNEDCLIAPTTIAYKAKGADARAWNRRVDNER